MRGLYRKTIASLGTVVAATMLVLIGTRGEFYVASAQGQEPPLLDLLVDRLGVYLSQYESRLGALVADELYTQEERRGSGTRLRKLDSEVTFLRLPGEAEWYGVRDVRKVDGKTVSGAGERLSDLLKHPGSDLLERAAAIVKASALHNLGTMRTINMPTVPLEVLSPSNHPRYIFKLRGKARVEGVQTERLDFEEFDEPTLVHAIDGGSLWSRGSEHGLSQTLADCGELSSWWDPIARAASVASSSKPARAWISSTINR